MLSKERHQTATGSVSGTLKSVLRCKKGERAEDLWFMELSDEQFLETPWYGSRQMARHLQRHGHKCGRHRVH